MSETSLFAELVKDRNMRELAMKRLAALTDNNKDEQVVLIEDNSQENNASSQEETTRTPPPPANVNIESIPVPKVSRVKIN